MRRLIPLALLLLAGCDGRSAAKPPEQAVFPAPARPVASIVSARWGNEPDREAAGEAETVLAKAGIGPGMTVADIGAGEGYYTLKLAARVGPTGRVLAQDVTPATRDALAQRVAHDGLENVSVKLGLPDDPKLPLASFDRVLMIHMYHEIASPYAFLWRLRPALKPGGRVIIVDADRQTNQHGTPPVLLRCELAAVGYTQVDFQRVPQAGGYLAAFEARGDRPAPALIKPCPWPPKG